MIPYIFANQALIRECINGVACVLFFTLSIMVAVFLWDTWAAARPTDKWQTFPGVPTACALWWVFISECYRTLNVWYAYVNSGGSAPGKVGRAGVGIFESSGAASSIGYLIAGVILCLGLLRSIYIFTPPDWKRRVWKLALAAAVIFILSPTLLGILIDAQ